jgi:hypothetical protein
MAFLHGEDDMLQLVSAWALVEGIWCDGSSSGGDSHICTTTAGGTAAVRSLYYRQTHASI